MATTTNVNNLTINVLTPEQYETAEKDANQIYLIGNNTDYLTTVTKEYVDANKVTINGGASTIVDSNLTTSRALISNSSGKVDVSAVTSTELGYLDGVTSNIQTQINNLANSAGGKTLYVARYISSGTWTCPTGVTKVKAIVFGGGGGGASYRGGGGGSGHVNIATVTVTPGTSYSVVVGAGGDGGTSSNNYNNGTNGGTGGTSKFGSLSAAGGSGGIAGNDSTAGNGGAGGAGGGAGGGGYSASGTVRTGGNGSIGGGGGGTQGGGTGGAYGGSGGSTSVTSTGIPSNINNLPGELILIAGSLSENTVGARYGGGSFNKGGGLASNNEYGCGGGAFIGAGGSGSCGGGGGGGYGNGGNGGAKVVGSSYEAGGAGGIAAGGGGAGYGTQSNSYYYCGAGGKGGSGIVFVIWEA